MFCPRCGESVDEGDRYCGACGTTLPRKHAPDEPGAPKRSLRERAAGLIGRSRRERLITAGTLGAVLVAVVAFLALDTAEEDGSTRLTLKDSRVVDDACLGAKEQIAAAATRAQDGGGLEAYSSDLLLTIVAFRSTVRSLELAATAELEEALLATAIDAGALVRTARESPGEVDELVGEVDADTGEIEAAIAELALERCPGAQIVPAPTDQ